ncbi:ABC-2 type transport system permease protein [Anaerocolumna jejuensis DSM 15929]|uniref:ABC-2 type transport system permease protein n=1 Tax=Anaerocolumna jejuensis DSM 15929 TaxID=1121322 RepID=A0A1M7CR54_9FIRM|nr:ABC transporter permease [Anaerocolumna jejuensis]SHL69754.1 ABC-2 type transport system permease protein [Anaerocolumna jejuensis DSM 15929]
MVIIMKRFLSILKLDFLNLFKNPVLVGANTIFSALLILVMGFLGSGNYAQGKVSYQYYLVSMMVFGMLNGAMTASNCFMERDIKKANLRIIYSPVGSFPIYFSKIAASFIFDYLLHVLVIAVLCPFLSVSIGANPGYFILLMAPVEFAAAALGIFFCCIFHSEEASSTLLSTVVSLLCVLGGTFFSLDGLGSTIAFLSKISPVRWLNEAFFTLSCDNSLHYFLPVFCLAVIISVLLVIGCSLTFRTEDYL